MNVLKNKLLFFGLTVAMVAATGCGGPEFHEATAPRESAPLVSIELPDVQMLQSLMVCTSQVADAAQRYEVYEWSDGSVLANCEVSDDSRKESNSHLYAAEDGSTAAAWALCLVEIPGMGDSAPVVWRFASHRALNTAGVSSGGGPGFGLHCQQVPVAR